MKTYYLHLINCEPAQFDGEQIVFATIRGNNPVKLCSSLKQIRREQNHSSKWRKENGYSNSYGSSQILRVSVEED